jgi:hypothetical protein
MVQDVEEFSRLFRVKVPLLSQAHYYVDLLSRSAEYDWLPDAARQFAAFEEECGTVSPGSTKMQWVLRIKEELLNSQPYRNYQRERVPREISAVQRLHDHQGNILFRIDIRSANYSVLRIFDQGRMLPPKWEAYLADRGVPEVLHTAKTFRQLIFGYLDSKGFQRHQLAFLDALYRLSGRAGFRGKDLLVLNGDELVLSAGNDPAVARERHEALLHHIDQASTPESRDLPNPYRGRLKVTANILQLEDIPDLKNAYVIRHFEPVEGGLDLRYRSLHGVPGSLFYRLFRELILSERPQPLDLLFTSENRLARWVLPDEV